MPDTILEPPPHTIPAVFTRDLLDWLPWLEPLAVEALTEEHMAALVDAARAKSAYFRLLARDPDALKARTLTDKDIFTIRMPVCRAPSVNWPPPRPRASMAASIARPYMPGFWPPIPSAKTTCSACWTTVLALIWASVGMPSSLRPSR
jgi:hypothetical protein